MTNREKQWKAESLHRQLIDKKRSKMHALMEEYRKSIQPQLDAEFDADIVAVAQKSCELRELADADDIADAKAKLPYPVGTILIGWSDKNSGWYSKTPNYQIVAKGIFEIVTADTEHPATTTYSRPSIGEYIVRLLKADGTPSKKYQRFSHYSSLKWLPEGKNPNGKKAKMIV